MPLTGISAVRQTGISDARTGWSIDYVVSMTDSWAVGTRVLLQATGVPVVTILLDSEPTEVRELLGAGREAQASGYPIEIRVSAVGSTRGVGDAAAEIMLIVQQVGLAAAGSGLWAAVETLLRRSSAVRPKQHGPSRIAPEPSAQLRRTLTVKLITDGGQALVHSETVGPANADSVDVNVEPVVAMLLAKLAPEPRS